MKEVIYNRDNLRDEDVNDLVVRIKVLLINNGKILIGNENSVFEFPGGHLEDGESFSDCLKREVKEETGIELDDNEIEDAFLRVVYLNKDYPQKGINRRNEIYYYVVKTNKKVDLSKTNYTENELKHNFKIEEFNLDEVIDRIKENIPNNEKNEVISRDMIIALEEYLKNTNH